MKAPQAVLLDSGGVFLLPDHERVAGAFARAEPPQDVDRDVLDAAHYRGAAVFTIDLDVEADWPGCWQQYLEAYVDACGVPGDAREEVHRHLDSEFADAALWVRPIAGAAGGLGALAACGVRLGVVSNADGLMAQRLAALEILQVGPGVGVEVETVVDSGAVGVMKPDARIFRLALEAMELDPADVWYVGDMPAIDVVGARRAGLHPFVVDPLGIHAGRGYDTIGSLAELAVRIAAARPG